MEKGKSLDQLRYLEKIIDFEVELTEALLQRKRFCIYSPEKTGTVTLFHTLGRYISGTRSSWVDYQHKTFSQS